jgi:hypothetical protein
MAHCTSSFVALEWHRDSIAAANALKDRGYGNWLSIRLFSSATAFML